MHRSEEAQFLFSSAHSRVAKPAAFRGAGQAAHGRASDHGRHSSIVLDRDVRSFKLYFQGDFKYCSTRQLSSDSHSRDIILELLVREFDRLDASM